MASSEPSSSKEGVAPPAPLEDLTGYLAYLQSKLQPPTRTAAQLPGPSDLSFHRSLDKSLAKELESAKETVLSTVNQLVESINGGAGSARKSAKGLGKSRAGNGSGQDGKIFLEDLVDADAFSRSLGDVVDSLLENADTCLDEYQGRVKPRAAPSRKDVPSARPNDSNGISTLGPLPPRILNANINPLPQTKFATKPDNSREKQWERNLTLGKPHAKVPLTWEPPPPADGEPAAKVGVRQGMYCAEGDPRTNPYYYEIHNFSAPSHATEAVPALPDIIPPPAMDIKAPTGGEPAFKWIDTTEGMSGLLAHLKEERVKEIALDVEHHNFRSFQGLVCLVQLSTRWGDYIIDALSPEVRAFSERLNEVMADPSKVKVLHGAEHDVLWLQRDLGIYLVGLFDTYHASNVLAMPQHSLAYLLHRYVSFEADKRFQLADWRIRPLPNEMLFYARSDTHTLLYVYDCMRFELSKLVSTAETVGGKDAIERVFELSKRTASKVYAKEEWDPNGEGREGWKTVWKKLGADEAVGVDERWEKQGVDGLNRTERIFRALHDWRDLVARREDESPRYILSAQTMLSIASRAPTTKESASACLGPAIKKRATDVVAIVERESKAWEEVQKAREAKLKESLMGAIADDDEEMGVAVEGGAETLPLWPQQEHLPRSNSGSSLATSLFGDTGHEPLPASSSRPSKPTSLFGAAPPRQASTSTRASTKSSSLFASFGRSSAAVDAVRSIKSELASALKGILGPSSLTSKSRREVEDDGDEAREALSAPETVAFVPKNDRREVPSTSLSASTSTNGARPTAEENRAVSEADEADSDEDSEEDIVQVSKKQRHKADRKEKKKKRKAVDSPAEAGGEELVPHDYSKEVSVLDLKGGAASSTKRQKKDKKKKKGEGKREAESSVAPGKERRYANVGTRDRREMAGGKSQSFAR